MNINKLKSLLKLTSFYITDTTHAGGIATYKVVLKYEGKQFTTSYSYISNKKFTNEDVINDLLGNYITYNRLSDSNYRDVFTRKMSEEEFNECYKECKKIKEGLYRLYGSEETQSGFKRINIFFNKRG